MSICTSIDVEDFGPDEQMKKRKEKKAKRKIISVSNSQYVMLQERAAVSHIQDFGDATTSPAEDATPRARDAGVGVRDAHL